MNIVSAKTMLFMDDGLYEAARMKGKDIPSASLINGELVVCRTRGVKSNILHVAAQYGNEEFIRSALTQLPAHHYTELLCEQNSKGETPLHLASRFGDKKTVEALLLAHDHGGDQKKKKLCWSERDSKGDTPLHSALRYGHQDIAILLLQRDVNLVSLDNYAGESPAYLAAENSCQRFLHTILNAYIDHTSVSFSGPLGMTLFHASTSLSEDIMLVLIERRKELLKHQDEKGKTVLHYAVEEAVEPMVETLLKADSSLACLHDNDGMTPLHRAARMGSFPMVRTILELSPQSVEICDTSTGGKTPLHVAKMDACFLAGCLRNTRMKELINVADDQGNTPLHLALRLDSPDLDFVDALLQVSGINWRLRNNDGCTPIDMWQSHEEIPFKLKSLISEWRVNMEILLCHKEDEIMVHCTSWDERLTYRGPGGDTILHRAARDGNMIIINEAAQGPSSNAVSRLLLLSGQNSKGETPLHLAAESGQLRVVEAILSLSNIFGNTKAQPHYHHLQQQQQLADLTPWRMRSANGDTPAHKALRHGHSDVALCLLRWEPQLVSIVSRANESLLYLAAQLPSSRVIAHILSATNKQYPISTSGPHGQNPLHAAVSSGGRVLNDILNVQSLVSKMLPFDTVPTLESVPDWIDTRLIESLPELVKKVDSNGKTPLHYAAELGQHLVVRELLKVDKSAALVYDNEGFTPLLKAASNGYHLCVKSILDLCPHSIELRHAGNQRTLLHLANLSKKFVKNHQEVAKLINETDIDGNTPLHCAIMESDEKKALELLSTQGVKLGIRNKQDQTPMDLCNQKRKADSKQRAIWVAFQGRDDVGQGAMPQKVARLMLSWFKPLHILYNDLVLLTEEDLKKLLGNIAVAAALLVTLTFAATFTIPGGYDQNTGQVLRMKEPAIQVFVASDVVAMLLGIGVLLKYTFGVTKHASWALTSACVVMLQYALLATLVTFVSGVYAIVSHDAKWIGILAIVLSVSVNYIMSFVW